MTITELPEDAEDFRIQLQGWLAENFTPEIAAAVRGDDPDESFAAARAWNATLVDAGYGAIEWPVEHGGLGASLRHQLVYNEETAAANCPGPVNAIGVSNIAPAIMAAGTPEQKERFLRPMLRGDEIWSQGMSEPEAGSDLASLRCRAIDDGDSYVVTGQKTWNSNGHRADWCQLYVRTNPDVKKHLGITCLIVDMTLPGIEARPIISMAGDSGFSEVFLEEVRVPKSALLGEVDQGWAVATNTLSHERAGVAKMYLMLRQKFDKLLDEAKKVRADGSRAIDDPVVRDEMMKGYIKARNLEFLAKRSIGAALSGKMPGAEGSVTKLAWAGTDQSIAESASLVLGMHALDGPWATGLLGSRSLTIAGGTTEVNKNIIGERVLGLPREPKPAAK